MSYRWRVYTKFYSDILGFLTSFSLEGMINILCVDILIKVKMLRVNMIPAVAREWVKALLELPLFVDCD